MNKLVRYVPDQDMRKGYSSLNDLVPLLNLGAGEFVAFVNRKQDKIKLATGNDVLLYHRMPQGKRLDPRVIQNLPRYLSGGKINYDAALRDALQKAFPKWFSSDNKK
jgi:hypothetical protein